LHGADNLAVYIREVSHGNTAMADEVAYLYAFIAEWVSVYRSLSIRVTELETVPFLSAEWWRDSRSIIANHWWPGEMVFWFRRAMLEATLFTRRAMDGHLYGRGRDKGWGQNPYFPPAVALCDRVLLYHSEYVNVHWVGFLATMGTLLWMCLCSFVVVWRVRILRAVRGFWRFLLTRRWRTPFFEDFRSFGERLFRMRRPGLQDFLADIELRAR
jgi:hypothetical protein